MSQTKNDAPRRAPVLIINHLLDSESGHIGRWFEDYGFPLDIRRPRFGDALPETLEEHTGVVIFGGPMSATEPEDYITQEIDWLEVPLSENKPLFGVCLGAQMLAIKLGGAVGFHAEGKIETGYYPIEPTAAGAALMTWPEQVYHWHREGFSLPSEAVLLARGATFENQAYRYGEAAFGIQFHPEISYRAMKRWVQRGAQRLALPGARPWGGHLPDHLRHGPEVIRWLDDFLGAWSGLRNPAKMDRS